MSIGSARLVRVTGRVQGVGFREWTRRDAVALALAGWVRNEPDGSVRALVAGSDEAIAEMLARLHHGPSFARVTSVSSETVDRPAGLAGFRIDR